VIEWVTKVPQRVVLALHEGMRGGGLIVQARAQLAALAYVALATAVPAVAQPVAEFYKGKTFTIIMAHTPGSGFDTYARLLGRHIGRYIPGGPTVVVSGMPGAGSVIAANHLYNIAPPDGTVIAQLASNGILQPLLGGKNARFKPEEFSWIGSMSQEVSYCGILQRPGAPSTWDEWLAKETLMGANSATSYNYQHVALLKALFGLPARIVSGYAGTKELGLAITRGEIAGQCGLFTTTLQVQWPEEVKSGQMKVLLQMGPKRTTEYGNVPSVFDLAKDEDTRQVLSLHFDSLAFSRPYLGPPKVPADRLATLREAFQAVLRDKDLLDEARKLGADIDPVPGEELAKLVAKFAAFRPEILERAAKVVE
jgi:tripartite-type tricarboxylate transporter receptor subunit TctC